jgi:hypothetical protein
VQARERQLALRRRQSHARPHPQGTIPSDLPEAKDMPTSMLQHYRVRLRWSRRLPYRIARPLLLALLIALLLIVYVAER